jgi:hypothetical protein
MGGSGGGGGTGGAGGGADRKGRIKNPTKKPRKKFIQYPAGLNEENCPNYPFCVYRP